MTDDAHLLRRFRDSGDQAAFAEVVRRHLGWTLALGTRRLNGDRQLAENVVQIVFAALARDADRVADTRPVAAWLHRSVCFAAAKTLRSELRHRRRVEALMTHDATGAGAAWGDAGEAETLTAMDEILNHASASDRSIILTRFLEGCSVQEVAMRFNLSEHAARKRIDRSLDRMRDRLRAAGINSTAEAIAGLLGREGAVAAPLALVPLVSASAMKASAAAGATKAGLLVALMNAKITTGVLAIVAIAGAGITIFEASRIHNVDAAIVREQRQVNLESVRHSARMAGSDGRYARPMNPNGMPGPAHEAEEDAEGRRMKEWVLQRGNLALSSDAYRAAWERVLRTSDDLRLAPFFRASGVSAAAADQVLAAIGEADARMFDLRTAAKDLGVSLASPAYRNEYDQSTAALASQLQSILGSDGYAAYVQFEQTTPDRALVQSVAQALYATPDSLTATQAGQLANLVIQNDGDAAHADVAATNRSLKGVNWDTVMAEAPEILLPNQMATLNLVVTRQQWNDELMRSINGYK